MTENVVARILFILGIAQMAIGFIIGLGFANAGYYGGIYWPIFTLWTLGGFTSGMLFVGFAEVIKLLHIMNERQSHSQKASASNSTAVQMSKKHAADEQLTREKIKSLYADEIIMDIIPANQDGYCLVKLKMDTGIYLRVVYSNNNEVVEINDQDIKKTIISWYNNLQL